MRSRLASKLLYILWFLHQTTTGSVPDSSQHQLYILWFLHQTTTTGNPTIHCWSCISFDSYIKPQLCTFALKWMASCISFDSYIKPQRWDRLQSRLVMLYILWFLHQTTTLRPCWMLQPGCISFDSYIKPQQSSKPICRNRVVYPLIPTSNHNL